MGNELTSQTAPETFVLELTRHADGSQTISITVDVEQGNEGSTDGDADDQDESSKDGSGVPPSKKAPKRPKLPIEARLNRLSSHWVTTSIAFFQVVPKLADQNFKFAGDELANRMRAYAEEVSSSVTEISDDETAISEFVIPIDELPIVANKIGKSTQVIQAADAMNRSTLGALVSEYEAFLASLLRLVSELRPEAFITDADTISVGDLERFESLEDVKSELVVSKIDDLLHSKSHIQVLDWISEKFKVNLTSNSKLISDFTEICQRRHLLTHAGGIVNKRYLRICTESGCDPEELPNLGDKVKIDRKYIRRATARVFQVGFFSLHIIWQKLLPADLDNSCGQILTSSHDFLENDLTKMCRRLADFVLASKTKPKDQISAYMVINKALGYLFDQALEESKKSQLIQETLASRDWSVKSPTIELALACVKQEFDDIEKLAEAAALDGVDYYDANTWAVFREVREKPEFLNKFKRRK
ncbi:hypothetical protein [uncultured Litoreibacter sp.]|uniref:hypothetical protein n=1 Tax=uncultured Litoreibacter sp. TaxID=1392394 RepID=UPI00262A60A3|nr:hypothetical protein [uncultured Litoreibacter sp.]